MIPSVLLIISLILLNLENISIFKSYSIYLSVIGIALFSGILVYLSFTPKNYPIGVIMVILITILTAFEKNSTISHHKLLFLALEILLVVIGFASNIFLK